MSFSIVLKRNDSEPNKLTKTLVTLSTVTGVLKDGTSIIDPVIMIEGDLASLTACNYMEISSFGRSYFVNDIVSVKHNLIEVYGHVDVLGTYAAQIKANTGIIHRQENMWNLYLNDGSFRVYQNPIVLTKEFPAGFTAQEFVLAVAGG